MHYNYMVRTPEVVGQHQAADRRQDTGIRSRHLLEIQRPLGWATRPVGGWRQPSEDVLRLVRHYPNTRCTRSQGRFRTSHNRSPRRYCKPSQHTSSMIYSQQSLTLSCAHRHKCDRCQREGRRIQWRTIPLERGPCNCLGWNRRQSYLQSQRRPLA